MSATAILSAIAPQFDTATARTTFLELAVLNVNTCLFGDKADMAVAYLAAHYLSLSTDPARASGESGQVTSKKEGDLSINFGSVNTDGNDSLSLTHFGMTFLQLSKSVNPGIYVLGSGGSCD